jgi:hypothetical protein
MTLALILAAIAVKLRVAEMPDRPTEAPRPRVTAILINTYQPRRMGKTFLPPVNLYR